MRILVTGAGGFLGGALVRRLSGRAGDEIVEARRNGGDGLAFDLRDRLATAEALAQARPDAVIHAAGRIQGSPEALEADNATATANLASTLARAAPDAGLVILGSAAQYGPGEPDRRWRESDPCRPGEPYGASKLAAEACAFAASQYSGLKVTMLRLFNVASAEPHGEQALARFQRLAASAIAAGPPPWRAMMGPLGGIRDFVSLGDVLTAVERVIDRRVWGERINVCTGVGRPTRALVEDVARHLGGPVRIEEAAGKDSGVAWSVGDPTLCEARLGFKPSADLSGVTSAAADWIKREAGAHARSRA